MIPHSASSRSPPFPRLFTLAAYVCAAPAKSLSYWPAMTCFHPAHGENQSAPLKSAFRQAVLIIWLMLFEIPTPAYCGLYWFLPVLITSVVVKVGAVIGTTTST